MLSRVIDNKSCYNLDNRNMLRGVTIKIGLEKIDTQKEVIVRMLLDSRETELVMSSEFARKQRFKLKKIEKLIYVRNVNSFCYKLHSAYISTTSKLIFTK